MAHSLTQTSYVKKSLWKLLANGSPVIHITVSLVKKKNNIKLQNLENSLQIFLMYSVYNHHWLTYKNNIFQTNDHS